MNIDYFKFCEKKNLIIFKFYIFILYVCTNNIIILYFSINYNL